MLDAEAGPWASGPEMAARGRLGREDGGARWPSGVVVGWASAWGVAWRRILGSDLRGSMWMCRKVMAWLWICFWRRAWVSDVVGRSRMRWAAMEYLVNASVRRLRTLVASVSWVGVGGVSGSLNDVSDGLAEYLGRLLTATLEAAFEIEAA